MTFHQVLGSETQMSVSLFGSATLCKPKTSLENLHEILEDVRRSLANDPRAARAGLARLSAILDGKEVALPAADAYARGGFAPWQKRRVEAYLREHLGQSILIKTLADMVSLSTSHFCRAFKQSFGETPHAYLMALRIERAKEMMRSTAEPLSQIALACGLADQAHLSKIFHRSVGQTPSVWRRLHDKRNDGGLQRAA